MKISWLVMVAAGALVTSTAYAKSEPKVADGETAADSKPVAVATKPASSEMEDVCKQLRHTVMITTIADVKSFEAARAKFDTQLGQLQQFAVSKHFTRLGLVSIDYSFNAIVPRRPRPASSSYKMRAIYQVANQDDAAMLGDYLVSKKLSANVSVRNPCNGTEAPTLYDYENDQ